METQTIILVTISGLIFFFLGMYAKSQTIELNKHERFKKGGYVKDQMTDLVVEIKRVLNAEQEKSKELELQLKRSEVCRESALASASHFEKKYNRTIEALADSKFKTAMPEFKAVLPIFDIKYINSPEELRNLRKENEQLKALIEKEKAETTYWYELANKTISIVNGLKGKK